jgi:hypothetical protein
MTNLLSKDHTILERPFMEFRPFGVDERGEKVRDVAGVIVQANVEYLEEHVAQASGESAGRRAVEDLCRLLNERLRDPAYHVTPAFLKNPWRSYSYEFVCYLREFGRRITGDPLYVLHTAMAKHVSQLIQVLCRPFPLQRIFAMAPYLGEKFSRGIVIEVVSSSEEAQAVVRMKFLERAYEQFGPYRRACSELSCQSAKGGLMVLPKQVHGLPPATITDLSCIVNGDEWCTYEIAWAPATSCGRLFASLRRLLTGGTR